MQRGELSWGDVSRLVEYWQEGNGLEPDGKAGPKTLATLQIDEYASLRVATPSQLAQEIVIVAQEEIGQGEQGANNSGAAIAKYRALPFDPDNPQQLYGEWCAFFVGWAVCEAHERLGEPEPEWRYLTGNGRKPVGGAKSLVGRAGRAGRFIAREGRLLEQPIPGDLFSLDRGRRGSRAGHVGIVEEWKDGLLHTIEGNVGRFPAKVRRFVRDPERIRLEEIARL